MNWMKNQKTIMKDEYGMDVFALERDLERRDNEPMNAYVSRWTEIYLALSLFYNHKAFKRRRLFLKRANQGEFDRALNAYLNVCGTNISTKHSNSKLIFIFGVLISGQVLGVPSLTMPFRNSKVLVI